jgi:hypothetical protein
MAAVVVALAPRDPGLESGHSRPAVATLDMLVSAPALARRGEEEYPVPEALPLLGAEEPFAWT